MIKQPIPVRLNQYMFPVFGGPNIMNANPCVRHDAKKDSGSEMR